jgi:hypothetical protein
MCPTVVDLVPGLAVIILLWESESIIDMKFLWCFSITFPGETHPLSP